MAATDEAVTIRRQLAETNPDAYLPYLARSLAAYTGVCLSLRADLPRALGSLTEAIDIYQPLADRFPLRFERELFAAHMIKVDVLDRLGLTGCVTSSNGAPRREHCAGSAVRQAPWARSRWHLDRERSRHGASPTPAVDGPGIVGVHHYRGTCCQHAHATCASTNGEPLP